MFVFDPSGPLDTLELQLNRAKLERVLEDLTSLDARGRRLIGGGRTGKTTAINYLARRLDRISSPTGPCVPVRVDCALIPARDEDDLWQGIYRQVQASLRNAGIADLDAKGGEGGSSSLALGSLILAAYRRARTVLLIDNIDALSAVTWMGSFCRALRGIIDGSRPGSLAVVVAASVWFEQYARYRETSPLFGMDGVFVCGVDPHNPAELRAEVRRLVASVAAGARLNDSSRLDLVERLIEWTGGHPWLLTVALTRLEDCEADLFGALEQLEREHQSFSSILSELDRCLSPDARALFDRVASGQAGVVWDQDRINPILDPPTDVVELLSSALVKLVRTGPDWRCEVASIAFRQWREQRADRDSGRQGLRSVRISLTKDDDEVVQVYSLVKRERLILGSDQQNIDSIPPQAGWPSLEPGAERALDECLVDLLSGARSTSAAVRILDEVLVAHASGLGMSTWAGHAWDGPVELDVGEGLEHEPWELAPWRGAPLCLRQPVTRRLSRGQTRAPPMLRRAWAGAREVLLVASPEHAELGRQICRALPVTSNVLIASDVDQLPAALEAEATRLKAASLVALAFLGSAAVKGTRTGSPVARLGSREASLRSFDSIFNRYPSLAPGLIVFSDVAPGASTPSAALRGADTFVRLLTDLASNAVISTLAPMDPALLPAYLGTIIGEFSMTPESAELALHRARTRLFASHGIHAALNAILWTDVAPHSGGRA